MRCIRDWQLDLSRVGLSIPGGWEQADSGSSSIRNRVDPLRHSRPLGSKALGLKAPFK